MPLECLGFYMYIILLTANDNFVFLIFLMFISHFFFLLLFVFLFVMFNRAMCKHTVIFRPDSLSRMDLLPQLLRQLSVGNLWLVAPLSGICSSCREPPCPRPHQFQGGLYPFIMNLGPAQENSKESF